MSGPGTPVTIERLGKALIDAYAVIWGTRVGGEATVAPSAACEGMGVLVLIPTNVAGGPVAIWVDPTAIAASARKVLKLDREPTPEETSALVTEIFTAARDLVIAVPEFTGVKFGAIKVGAGGPPREARSFFLAVANAASCQIAVGLEPKAAAAAAPAPPPAAAPASAADHRLDAVLDVDLPLIVRFGRAVMPLNAIADLGPGSVVDMGRSPDEPVELLVGERLIARGEVVIVAGNYGVRITELIEGRGAAPELEARTS